MNAKKSGASAANAAPQLSKNTQKTSYSHHSAGGVSCTSVGAPLVGLWENYLLSRPWASDASLLLDRMIALESGEGVQS